MKPMHLRLIALTALTALLTGPTGCYYAFGTAPPAHVRTAGPELSSVAGPSAYAPAPAPVRCTRSRALPIADTVIALEGALATGLGVLVLASHDDGSLSAGEAKAGGIMFLMAGLPMLIGNGLSARRGFADTARCRALR